MNISNELALISMIVWEELQDRYANQSAGDVYSHMRDKIGVCQFRQVVIDVLAPMVEFGYNKVSDKFDEPFDFEFVPSFLSHLSGRLSSDHFSFSESLAESTAIAVLDEIDQEDIDSPC